MSSSSVGQLESAALKRKERLAQLKAKRQKRDQGGDQEDQKDTNEEQLPK